MTEVEDSDKYPRLAYNLLLDCVTCGTDFIEIETILVSLFFFIKVLGCLKLISRMVGID